MSNYPHQSVIPCVLILGPKHTFSKINNPLFILGHYHTSLGIRATQKYHKYNASCISTNFLCHKNLLLPPRKEYLLQLHPAKCVKDLIYMFSPSKTPRKFQPLSMVVYQQFHSHQYVGTRIRFTVTGMISCFSEGSH